MSDAINPASLQNDPNTGNVPGVVMNTLPTNTAAFYLQQAGFWQGQVTILETLYAKLASSTLDEYEERAGDGMQKGKRKDINKIGAELNFASSQYRYYFQKIYGRGIMTLRLRRKG